jgi:nicotinate phosphoribosyltransferase
VGGRKSAARRIEHGVATAERVYVDRPAPARDDERPLLSAYVRDGDLVATPSLAQARERFRASRAELPAEAMKLSAGDPALDVDYVRAG